MVTAGIFPFRENSHGRAGNRTRDLMISSQRLWPLDHEAVHPDDKVESNDLCWHYFITLSLSPPPALNFLTVSLALCQHPCNALISTLLIFVQMCIMMFVLQIYRTLANEYISHHPSMKAGRPNCTNHSLNVFENGVINAGSWKEHEGSMIVS